MCNNINTRKVDAAVAAGAGRARCVLKHHGCQFNCGQCATAIRQRIADMQSAPELAAAQ